MAAVAILEEDKRKDLLRFVTAGSVDDGKSTLIGRLLYESKGIYEDQLDAVRRVSGKVGSSQDELDLALVTDGLKAEREQGITIDVAYRYFSTPKRKFIIADTPGHEQYTRNMATGRSTASLTVILIDAAQGVLTQSKRHMFIAALLGIPHVVVAVNKMDLVNYSREVFEKIRSEFADFAAKLEVTDLTFIPVSALMGDNVVTRSDNMPWYNGSALLNHLETVHIAGDRNLIDLRFPVQCVLRPDSTFRGYLGTAASGIIRPGDEIAVLPAGTRSRVKKVLGPDGEIDEAFPPLAATILLEDEIDVSRGDMLVHVHNLPRTERTLDAMIVWMATEEMQTDKTYRIKHCTTTVPGVISEIRYRVDVNTLHRALAEALNLNEIGRCLLTLNRPIVCDPYRRNRATGAFIIIDTLTNNTVGAGMILDREVAETAIGPEGGITRTRSEHVHRHESLVASDARSARLGHKPATVWLTGLTGSGKSTVAYALEKRLFEMGFNGYVLDGENARLGFSRDLGFSASDRSENVRRAAEMARAFNEAGLICVCAFLSPFEQDRAKAAETVGPEHFIEVYLSAPVDVCRQRDTKGLYDLAQSGEIKQFSGVTSPYEPPASADLTLPTHEIPVEECVERIITLLQDRGVILGAQVNVLGAVVAVFATT